MPLERSSLRGVAIARMGAVLAIAFFFSASFLSAILYDGQYSPVNNYISDLGNLNKNPSGHLIFDIGCILSGLAIILFVFGLSKLRQNEPGQVRMVRVSHWLGYVMGFSIAMVGTFSSDLGAIHFLWATCFFVLLIVFMSMTNIGLKGCDGYPRTVFYFAIGSVIIGLGYVLTFAIGFPSPLLEWLSVVCGLIWIGLVGILAPRIARKA